VYSFTDSALKVLEEFGSGKPMHYKDITREALNAGWLVTEGKTPESTMYAQILTEIKRYTVSGRAPRFTQHGKGLVLSASYIYPHTYNNSRLCNELPRTMCG